MKKTEQVIKKHFDKLVTHLNLQDWKIRLDYMDGDCFKNEMVAMDNTIDLSYLRSTIRIYPVMEENTKEVILETICHELCHVITEPMYSLCRGVVSPMQHEWVEEMREQETERICRIALKNFK